MTRRKRFTGKHFSGIELVITNNTGQSRSRWKPEIDIDALPAMLKLILRIN
jgi:hypothetical protein